MSGKKEKVSMRKFLNFLFSEKELVVYLICIFWCKLWCKYDFQLSVKFGIDVHLWKQGFSWSENGCLKFGIDVHFGNKDFVIWDSMRRVD